MTKSGWDRVLARPLQLSPLSRYAIAVGAGAAGVLLRLALEPIWGNNTPFLIAFPAIAVSAWAGGLGPGSLTTLISAVTAAYFWVLPARSGTDLSDAVALLAFVLVGVAISALLHTWRESVKREQRARADAEAAARQLEIALDAGRMGTWQWMIRTGEVKWSPGLETIHGYAPGSFPQTFEAFREEIHPEDRQRVLGAISGAVEHGRDHHIEYRIVRTDGSTRWVEGRGQLFRDAAGSPERMVGVCVDTTQRVEAETERARLIEDERRAKRAAEEANRVKDRFVAMLSHEMRTPLEAILGYTHLLKSGTLSSERFAHAVKVIQRTVRTQARLIDSLLDLSRIEAGKLELQMVPVDLLSVATSAVDVVRPMAEAKDITLRVIAPDGVTETIGDSGRLEQVLWNLLSTAVKFTPVGGRVELRIERSDGTIALQMSDTGQGISKAFLPYVFDPFAQASQPGAPAETGLGLGPAIVRKLVKAHGGSLAVHSEGQGSTFTVRLPALTTDAPQIAPTEATA